MSKKYFYKMQKTSDQTITCFYYNKKDINYNNIDFINKKINDLIKSEKTSDNVKKQLKRLKNLDLKYYDLFFIYSNAIKIGINHNDKVIDFYDNDYDQFIDQDYFKNNNYHFNYNTKIKIIKSDQDHFIDQDIISDQDILSDQD